MKSYKPNIKGIAGEVFAESYCKQNKIKFKKATKEEDMTLGIDAYIGDRKIPSDVKNTPDLFVCQIMEDGIINVRHPFKLHSKATHYFFVEVDGTGTIGKFLAHIPIKDKLLNEFILSEESLKGMKNYLNSIDHCSYKKLGTNLSQASFKIKKDILQFCKDNVNISYDEPVGGNKEISFRMLIQKKKETKSPTFNSINTIRQSIKGKLNSINDTPQKPGVIVIKI